MGKISVETDKVFKISLPGYDVDTATPEQCAVHSGFDYPKIEESLEGYEEVTLASTIPGGTHILKIITHNYGYKPNALVFIDTKGAIVFDTDFDILPYAFTDPIFYWFDFEVTDTELKIEFIYNDPGMPFGGDLVVDPGYSPAGETVGFKWQVWVND